VLVLSLRSLIVLLALLVAACGDDGAPADTGIDSGVDTGPPDTGPADTGPPDTGMPDTGPPDTGPPPYGLDTLVYNEDCVVEVVNPDMTIDVAATISETGCYQSLKDKTVISALIPFDLVSPLWTDGVAKRRFMAIPPGTTVGYEPDFAWDFPLGTILMKEFVLQPDENDPSSEYVMETRFLVKYRGIFWRGYSYVWNAEGTEATLMDNVVDDVILQYEVTEVGGSVRMHDHVFPARVTCLQCHAPRANGGNGPQTAQMNRNFDWTPFGGTADNQLRALEHIGFFTEPLPGLPDDLPRMVDPKDETASLEDRARAYIHANCAHCHRDNGSAITSTLWIPWETPLEDSNACIGRDSGGTPSMACESLDIRLVAGDSDASLIRCVMESGEMPPVGTYLPDPTRQVVFDWIDSLSSCP